MATPTDKLAETIAAELQAYSDGVKQSLAEATKKVTQAGVEAVKAASRENFGGTGRYARGWTSKFETNVLSTQGVIYNKDVPGLPHLLEHGHAKRNGGRTPGTPHIAPVEEMIANDFAAEVEKNL